MKKLISALLAAIFLAVSPAAAEPKFGEYPTKMYLKGKPVPPKFAGSAAQFKTRIRNGMKSGSNYGGHFSLIEIGCGTSCIFAFLIDGRDGRVVDFPLGGEDKLPASAPLWHRQHSPASRLDGHEQRQI